MERRVDVSQVAPEPYRRVAALNRYVGERVDPTIDELVKIRASVLNGCAFCVDMHTTDALGRGEEVRRLAAVPTWPESPFFDDRERAALALTDAVTRLGSDGVPDAVWDDAVAHFGTEGAVDLLFAVATINVWNRVALTSRMQPPPLAG